ncbi:hypothetical protein Tco_0752078 [Tanacetum coccineum]|uniref:Reverse transcriptase domain-containing protein n=1 Tax=Tanacetum coccineum TaxID=301880 RepID=A0ABQ4Z8L3_9ASTR
METRGRKKVVGEPAPPARDPRDVETIERLQQRIQELELQQLRPNSPTKEAKTEPNKCYADGPLVMPLEGIHVDDKLQFVEEPIEIMEREIKRLKRSRIPLVKVRWNSRRGPEFTWEREDSFKQKYPQLFTNRASSSTTSNALGYSISAATQIWGCYRFVSRAKPVIPPPSTDITTTGAKITVRLQASISLPLEAEVERLLAMPTPPPSPPISLSPPSAGERLARCMAPSAHSSPPPVPSPLLPSFRCPTQIQTLKIASTQALVDEVTAALPSPPLPPLPPSLYIPPPVDRRDDIPKSERPPRKRSCLFALGSRYEVGESSTARPTGGRGIDYGFVSTLDAEKRRRGIREVGYGIRDTWVDPAEAVPEIAPMTVGEVNTMVTELAELHEHDTQDLYAILEDAQDRDDTHCGGGGLCFPRGLGSCDRIESGAEMAELRETDRKRQAQMVETLRVMRDMRREMGDMQAELLALREQRRRARQPAPDARVPDHQDASKDADSHI